MTHLPISSGMTLLFLNHHPRRSASDRRHQQSKMTMRPDQDKRLKALAQRRNERRTHYLWRDMGESLEEVRERFRRMVEEKRANENDDYIIFRWQW